MPTPSLRATSSSVSARLRPCASFAFGELHFAGPPTHAAGQRIGPPQLVEDGSPDLRDRVRLELCPTGGVEGLDDIQEPDDTLGEYLLPILERIGGYESRLHSPRTCNLVQHVHFLWPRVWNHAHRYSPKGGYTPTLFTMLDADLGELHTSRHLGQ
jgi:hypothetical protein